MSERGWFAFPGRFLRRFRPSPPRIPDDLWQRVLARNVLFSYLDATRRERLKKLSETFLAEKEFSGAKGLALNDGMLTTIAAQACLPILELGLSAYRGWIGIIIYPDEFLVPGVEMDAAGVLHEYAEAAAGEAWEGGPVILSWHDVQQADDRYNVVIHEFAHKLDMLNNEADGVPALHSGLSLREWEETLGQAHDDFLRRLEKGESLPLDDYGAEDPAEFFAVASECFFVNPRGLRRVYPDFYRLLSRYYRQNPALWNGNDPD
jgi:Mlc titration factor MtfA (ptsG expression regulator)